jgi:glycosyltransferase involved in cell wall biosynthesis
MKQMETRNLCHVHDWLTVPGGAEEVLRHLHQVFPGPILCAQYNPEKFPWLADEKVISHWISNLPLSKTKHYLYAPILGDVYRSISCEEFDTIVCNSHTFAHGVKVREDATFYCYYHTVARSIWLPEIDGRAGNGFFRRLIINRIKKLDIEAAKHPTYIVANSQTTKARIEKFYKRPVDEVIYPPVDTEKFAAVKRTSDKEGYLIWGRQIAYKRTDLAIEAAKKMGFKLNIVGSGPMIETYKALAEGAPNVVFHGRLSDEDLLSLMGKSKAFLFPAYEDFGIVVVEALAAGLPVVAYQIGGGSESVTSEVGEWIQEQTVNSLCEAIERFEKREFDPFYARQRASLFSIDRFHNEFKSSLVRAQARGAIRNFL